MKALELFLKQPFSVIATILGAALIALPLIQIDEHNHLATHPPTSLVPLYVGIALLVVGTVSFGLAWWTKHKTREAGAGLDLTRVSVIDLP